MCGHVSGPNGQLQGDNTVFSGDGFADAYFDAYAGFGPGVDDIGGAFGIGVFDVGHFSDGAIGKTDAADVDKGENLGAGGGGDEVAEGEEIGPAGAASVNDGGDAGSETEGIGLNAPGGRAGKDVGMDIDPAGGEDFASKVQGFSGGIGDGFGEGGNGGILNGDIADGVEVLGGINNGGIF